MCPSAEMDSGQELRHAMTEAPLLGMDAQLPAQLRPNGHAQEAVLQLRTLELILVRMDSLSRLQLATEMMAMQTIAMAVQAPELSRLDGHVHLEAQQQQVCEKILVEMVK